MKPRTVPTHPTSAPADIRRRLTFVTALYNGDFRALWYAFICSSLIQRIDGIMLGWLVLEMTDSAFLVGLIAAVRFLGVLVLIGMAQSLCLTNIAILLLGTGRGEMRGRLMGLRSLAVAPLFAGSMLSGMAAEHIGAPLTTIVCGLIGLLIVVCIAPWVPRRMPG
jgi:hypothetical protein